ncbi:MAG: YbaK/EbsC family protein [Solobacterium sp.]|nr:YbaK/EbsC family protein [Erysipelotrichaceae bacterium]MBQ2690016.1 YbaK/EbsC family protein [Solobacterium sp.]MBQ6591345.1 YbaK/EbsC family protein [Solobacterium sp.]MBR0479530.1 YbaK/EbsC family protein [Solobacterium sp.]
MSVETVKAYFRQFGMEDRILEMEESTATVALAAQTLGCREQEITKTMSFALDEETIIICMAGDAKISNHKYKETFHKKARMLRGEEVVERTGHLIGGVCPFGLKEGCTVYLDESLKRFAYVYPACGGPHAAIKLSLEELEKYSGYKAWIDVCDIAE